MSKKQALVVIALRDFQDQELEGTIKGLEHANFQVTLCGKEADRECVGKKGKRVHTTLAIRDVNVDLFDRIAFIGGPGAHELKDDKETLNLAKEFYEKGKVLGAICIAPTILASAGLLQGKCATVWSEKEGEGDTIDFLQNEGKAKFVPKLPVVVDMPFVTAHGPEAADEFGKVLAAS